MPFSFRGLLYHFVHKNSFSADVPCFKTVFFFCALLANIQQAFQGIVTLQKIVLYRFETKSSFIGQGKNTLSIKIVLENLSHYLSYENQQLLPEILDGTNDRRRTSRNFPTSSHLCLLSGAR